MWLLLILILLILLPFIYLLFAPFFIEIDSETNVYRLRFHRLASGSIVQTQGSLFLKAKILWHQYDIDLLASRNASPKKVSSGQPVKMDLSRNRPGIRISQIKAMLMSFRISKCSINIDTGDMPTNAILYPLFFIISWETGHMLMVNFQGKNSVTLDIRNSIARLAWAYVTASKK